MTGGHCGSYSLMSYSANIAEGLRPSILRRHGRDEAEVDDLLLEIVSKATMREFASWNGRAASGGAGEAPVPSGDAHAVALLQTMPGCVLVTCDRRLAEVVRPWCAVRSPGRLRINSGESDNIDSRPLTTYRPSTGARAADRLDKSILSDNMKHGTNSKHLRVIPLGRLDGIGRNMTVLDTRIRWLSSTPASWSPTMTIQGWT